jgi:hypothetical protein
MRAVSRTALVVLCAMVLTSLAGCSGKGPKPAETDFSDLDLDATSTTGIVRGVVVDDAIRPIAGVHLSMPVDGKAHMTNTSAEGLFGYDDLQPGTYFIQASKLGYRPAQASVDVVAGVKEPPVVRIQLVADASFKAPYYEQYTFEGFIECSTGAAAAGGYVYFSACSASPEAFPNDKFATSYVLTGYPELVQSEMTWDSTQAASRSLAHNFYYADPDETDGYKDLTAEGESPLVNTMDNETAKEYIEGLDYKAGQNLTLAMRVFTRATDGTGPALTVEQKFTVYTTIFYGYLPPTGWTLMDSGQVPPPPQ